jgi:hypothetical protein
LQVTVTGYQVVTLAAQNQQPAPATGKAGAATARMCLTQDKSGNGIGLTWHPWRALTAAGAAYVPPSAYGPDGWPGALYPNDPDPTYHVGRCVSGVIPFIFTGPDRPVVVEYNTAGIVLDWRLP